MRVGFLSTLVFEGLVARRKNIVNRLDAWVDQPFGKSIPDSTSVVKCFGGPL